MEVYYNDELLNFEQVHLTLFENDFYRVAETLPTMLEPNFSSLVELKNKNKEILSLAFDAELAENT